MNAETRLLVVILALPILFVVLTSLGQPMALAFALIFDAAFVVTLVRRLRR